MLRGSDGEVSTVAFGRGCQVDGALAQWNASFGPTNLVDDVEGGVGQQQSVGVSQSYVLGGEDTQAARNELGVFAALNEAGEPIDGRIGVATTDALDESRDDVVVHLAVLVEGEGILLQSAGDNLVVDHKRLVGIERLHDEVENVEQLACVAARETQQCLGLLNAHLAVLEHLVGLYGMVQQT